MAQVFVYGLVVYNLYGLHFGGYLIFAQLYLKFSMILRRPLVSALDL